MLTTRADALREKIERRHRRLREASPSVAEQLRELSALSAELAGIEGGGYGERWRRIDEVAAELGAEPRVLKAHIREAKRAAVSQATLRARVLPVQTWLWARCSGAVKRQPETRPGTR
jgi:hypothetical protein